MGGLQKVGQAAQRWGAVQRSASIAKRFMLAKSERISGYAQVAAKSLCRGAAQRCAAAVGLDSALGVQLQRPLNAQTCHWIALAP
jgi:hypothetical protein